jgi:hypothetical protein
LLLVCFHTFVYDASSHPATRLVLRSNDTALAEYIQKDCTAFIVHLLSSRIVTMDTSNILELCVAILTIVSIQFLVIAALAAHSISHRFTPLLDPGKPDTRPQNPRDRSPQNILSSDIPPPFQYVFPYVATVNDTASSLYSQPTLPPRPQNPVPHSRASVRLPKRRHSYDSAHDRPSNTRLAGNESSEETVGEHVS